MMNTVANTMTLVNSTLKAFEEWINHTDLDESEVKRELKRVFPGAKIQGVNYGLYTRSGYQHNTLVALIQGITCWIGFYEYNPAYDQDSDEYLYR